MSKLCRTNALLRQMAQVEFAKELLLLLENDTPEQIEMFYCFNKEGLVKLFSQLP